MDLQKKTYVSVQGIKYCTSKLDWLKVGSGAESSIRTYEENSDFHDKKRIRRQYYCEYNFLRIF